jgi:molybdate transport system permease protein
MDFSSLDMRPIWLSLQLAAFTVVILLLLGMPFAWWLSRTRSRAKVFLEAITALPLVLPPTVLGFYLLVLMGSQGVLGSVWQEWTGYTLAFSFAGLLIASCLYSLPFVVQPLQAAFAGIDQNSIDAAWTLGASRLKTFFTITLPQARQGVLAAVVLGFAHTLGEFGVVLMVGGNIPGETQVLAIAIYDQVEALEYANAHMLSVGLLLFSFVVLAIVYGINRHWLIEVRG